MATRRGAHRRGAARRKTTWFGGIDEINTTASAAGIRRDVPLFVPLEDHEGATVIRIVGSVVMGLQGDQVGDTMTSCAWGIYKAGSGSAGDLELDPISALDRDSEHWMHMRFLWRNKSTGAAGKGDQDDLANNVDIKVMRKVEEGDGLKLVFNSLVAYVAGANLRVLLLHT